jgi:hypothetical protein
VATPAGLAARAVEGAAMRIKPSDRPPLSPSVVAVLLSGWTARPPGGRRADDPGLFELWQANGAGCAALWQQHAAFLRAEAARWGVAPEHGPHGAEFFGETCARELTQRGQRAVGPPWMDLEGRSDGGR